MELQATPTINVLIEISTYIMAVVVLIHAWRQQPSFMFLMLSAMLFGFFVEYSAVSKLPAPYHYPQSLIALPGPVPLNICLGWGIIIYAALQTAIRLRVKLWLQPLVAGFLAVIIDFAEDPSFVAMKLWVWTPSYPDAWFGMPWSNYVGWFFIVASFLFSLQLLSRRYPVGQYLWRDALIAFVAIIPSFIAFIITVTGFLWLAGLGITWLNQALMIMLLFIICAIPVMRALPSMARDNKIDWVILAVPAYTYAWSIIGFFKTELYLHSQALVIVMPLVVMIGLFGYLWPSLNIIFPSAPNNINKTNNKPTEGDFCDQENN